MAKIQYYKPNMSNLRGFIGRSIIKTIMNTPKPDRTKLRKEADACLDAILKEQSEPPKQI